MTQFLLLADSAAAEGGIMTGLLSMWPILLMFAALYFMMIRPQRKREKAVQEMRSKLEIGDEIVTVGGVIGRIVSIRDDSIVVETGSDRSKLRIARWAVQTNNAVRDTPAETK